MCNIIVSIAFHYLHTTSAHSLYNIVQTLIQSLKQEGELARSALKVLETDLQLH